MLLCMLEYVNTIQCLIQTFIRKFGLLVESHTPCGLPISVSKAHALMELRNSSGVTQNELACCLFLSKSNISRMISQLMTQGHVKKIRDKKDGRVFRICLTSKGQRLAQTLEAQSREHFKKISKKIPPKQRNNIIDMLELLIQSVEKPAAIDTHNSTNK